MSKDGTNSSDRDSQHYKNRGSSGSIVEDEISEISASDTNNDLYTSGTSRIKTEYENLNEEESDESVAL